MKTSLTPKSSENRLAINAAAGMAATIIYLTSRILLTPFVLSHLTISEFGLWSMCFVILSYASMGAFGVNNTYIHYSARYHASGNYDPIFGLLSTGLACMFLFCSLFIIVLWGLMPLILKGFGVTLEMTDSARIMILGTAVIFSLDLTAGGFRAVLEGLQEIALVKKIGTCAAIFEVIAIVLLLSWGFGVRGMLYAYVIRVGLETITCIIYCKRMLPDLSISPGRISKTHMRQLFVFGGKVQAIGAMAIFLSSFDRMIISAMVGLSAAGMFELGRKFPFTAKSVSGAAFGPFFPAAAKLGGGLGVSVHIPWKERLKNHIRIASLALCTALLPAPWFPGIPPNLQIFPWAVTGISFISAITLLGKIKKENKLHIQEAGEALRNLYIGGTRAINLINITLFGFIAAVGAPLLRAWVGDGYPEATGVLVFLSGAYLVQQSTGPVTLILRGMDRCGREMELLTVHLILSLAWVPAGTYLKGLMGAAFAVTASTTIAAIFFIWRSNSFFRVGTGEFFRTILLPGILPIAASVATFGLTQILPNIGRIGTAIQIITCGILYLLLLLPLIWSLALTPTEKKRVLALNPFSRKNTQSC